MSDREWTGADFGRAIKASVRKRLERGELKSGGDIVALRAFAGLSQEQFAQALNISVHTLRNWEQGRRSPEGPALALLSLAARHPSLLRERIGSVTPGRANPGRSTTRLPSTRVRERAREQRRRGATND